MSTITRPTATVSNRSRTTSVGRLLVALVLVVIVAGTGALAHLGSERMRDVAPLGSSDSHGHTVTGYGWSIRPTGFTVRYDDGSSLTRLWW